MRKGDKGKVHLKFLWQYLLELFVLLIGIAVLMYGFNDKIEKSVCYKEDNNVSYKVFLKENNYFDSNYLEEGKTYIASLIDYINIDYTYKLDFTEEVSGSYKYFLRATVKANKPNNEEGTYWSKDYNLKDEVTREFEDTRAVVITDSENIDYATYNKILSDFKKDYDLDTDGELEIALVVETFVNNDSFKKKIPSKLSLSIPLLEKAVNANISKNVVDNANCIVSKLPKDKMLYTIIKTIGIFVILLSIVLAIGSVIRYRIFSRNNEFELQLNRLLTNHDSIIASVEELPDISDYNVVDVVSFNELLDVYNEVRMPINYCRVGKVKAIFLIINDNMAWKYEYFNEGLRND